MFLCYNIAVINTCLIWEEFMNIAIVEDLVQDRERVSSCLNRYMKDLGLTYHLYTYESAEEFVEAFSKVCFAVKPNRRLASLWSVVRS